METIGRICPMCGTINTIEIDDKAAKALEEYKNGNGYIQDIPLPAAEREFIKTGFCLDCQEYLFAPPEDEEEWEDDSNIGCSDCPDDECTGHCMSCSYRPV